MSNLWHSKGKWLREICFTYRFLCSEFDLSAQFLRCMRLISVNLRSLSVWFSPWDWVPHPKSSFQNRNLSSSSLWLLSGMWILWPCRRENGDLDKMQERKVRIIEPDYSIQHELFCFQHLLPTSAQNNLNFLSRSLFFIIFLSSLRLTFYHNLFKKKTTSFFFFALILKF